MVKEKVALLAVLICRYCRTAGAAVRRAVVTRFSTSPKYYAHIKSKSGVDEAVRCGAAPVHRLAADGRGVVHEPRRDEEARGGGEGHRSEGKVERGPPAGHVRHAQQPSRAGSSRFTAKAKDEPRPPASSG